MVLLITDKGCLKWHLAITVCNCYLTPLVNTLIATLMLSISIIALSKYHLSHVLRMALQPFETMGWSHLGLCFLISLEMSGFVEFLENKFVLRSYQDG